MAPKAYFLDQCCLLFSVLVSNSSRFVPGTSLISGASTSAPVAGEAYKALWALMSSMRLATGKGEQRQGFPLAALRGFAENWADDKKGDDDSCRGDEGASAVVETVTDCIAKSRGVQVAGSYALLHGSDAALSATIQVYALSTMTYFI
jgi:hypothetical protein